MIVPKCLHFGECGGCRFQHISYEEQLKQKHQYLVDLYQKEIDPFIPCETPWHYRNKMEFSFSQSKTKERFLGLMKKSSRGKVVSLEMCYLSNRWMIDALKQIKKWWMKWEIDAYHPYKNQGPLRTLILREGMYTKQKMAMLTISGNPSDALSEEQERTFVESLLEKTPLHSIILRKQILAKRTPTRMEEKLLYGQDHIHEMLHDASGRSWHFKIRAPSFFQPNTLQAEKLYQKVIEMAEIEKENCVFDLYCGTGSLGMFASSFAKNVFGVELEGAAVQDAQENMRLNLVTNMEVVRGDVEDVLSSRLGLPDIVIIDPPRAGLTGKALQHLKQLSPSKIVYVSCNPSTQASNCKELTQAGYYLERIQPVDQFPHTPHIEVIALLKKKGVERPT